MCVLQHLCKLLPLRVNENGCGQWAWLNFLYEALTVPASFPLIKGIVGRHGVGRIGVMKETGRRGRDTLIDPNGVNPSATRTVTLPTILHIYYSTFHHPSPPSFPLYTDDEQGENGGFRMKVENGSRPENGSLCPNGLQSEVILVCDKSKEWNSQDISEFVQLVYLHGDDPCMVRKLNRTTACMHVIIVVWSLLNFGSHRYPWLEAVLKQLKAQVLKYIA